jgi:putative tricarboxylic transport membrane protein
MIRGPKDFCAALIYLAIGLGAIFIGRDLPMGTGLKMGPAYFPTVLGGLLAFIGLISLVRSFLRKGAPIPGFAWKPLLLITGATVVFGLLVRGAGLAIALPLFVFMTAFASVKFRWGTSLALAACATLFCALVFVKGLGVPLPLIGRWFGG